MIPLSWWLYHTDTEQMWVACILHDTGSLFNDTDKQMIQTLMIHRLCINDTDVQQSDTNWTTWYIKIFEDDNDSGLNKTNIYRVLQIQ